MKLVKKTLVLAITMLAAVSMFAQKGETSKLEKKIQDMNDEMAKAMINDDLNKLMSYYDKNVISMPNYAPILFGSEEMMVKQKESSAKGNKVTDMKMTTMSVTDYGDVLVEIGSYSITMEIKGMPGPVSDKGKYLTIWKKYDDGYQILNEIWNTDVNPMFSSSGKSGEKPSPVNDTKMKPQEQGKTKSGKNLKSSDEK